MSHEGTPPRHMSIDEMERKEVLLLTLRAATAYLQISAESTGTNTEQEEAWQEVQNVLHIIRKEDMYAQI